MAQLKLNIYKIKKKILYPYIKIMKYKERNQSHFIKCALDIHYYRPAFYRFMKINMQKPDLLYDAPIKNRSVIVDVGAYSGEWAEKVYNRYNAKLYAFELDPSTFPLLNNRFIGKSDVFCFDYGLGKKDEVLTLTQCGMGSTLYDGSNAQVARTVKVNVRDIVSVFDELNLNNIDLLKINIEGGEYDLLDRLIESGRIAIVDCLMVQFHEWLDNANFRRLIIRHRLKKTHKVIWSHPFIWEQWVRK
jgi:FkbM family methyltransferase